jgi:dihydrofolate reductase
MSLDGFVADGSDQVGALFDWYGNGASEIQVGGVDKPFTVSEASATYIRRQWSSVEVCVIGRRLFDITDGWRGVPAVGSAVVVVSHRQEPPEWRERFPDAPFAFVSAGLAEAVGRAKSIAGDRDVSMTSGNLLGQALDQGLVDEIRIDLVPVVFGSGIRYFGDFTGAHRLLEDPDEVVQGDRVLHLRYRVRTVQGRA